jgi:hypothetical protein
MEQDRKAKGVVQAEEWVEESLTPEVKAGVLVWDPVEIASAQVAVNEKCIRWGFPAMSRNAQGAVRS